MSQRAIHEFDAKNFIGNYFNTLEKKIQVNVGPCYQLSAGKDLEKATTECPWLTKTPLVHKPDQLIKRRGKLGLIQVKATWDQVKEKSKEWMNKEQKIGNITGVLNNFIVEPFVAHEPKDEMYLCIITQQKGDEILFFHQGGVDVGDVDAKAKRHFIPIETYPNENDVIKSLLQDVPANLQKDIAWFIVNLYTHFVDLHFSYMEINPLVVNDKGIFVLDLAAKIDETASFECYKKWAGLEFPSPFGRPLLPEEAYIKELDGKTGASLKLTILNMKGRIWTMVAGGGASVIYADTVADLGAANDLANYGEYSGDPSEEFTFQYAKTILDLMTRDIHPQGKILLIGGGIANFTDVAATFKGIARALTMYKDKLIEGKVKLFIRRGGPNYKEGLTRMRNLASELNINLKVHGPELNLTSIVAMALSKPVLTREPSTAFKDSSMREQIMSLSGVEENKTMDEKVDPIPLPKFEKQSYHLFAPDSQVIIYGLMPNVAQRMMDYDYICNREKPSVACLVYGFQPTGFQRVFWGAKQYMLPLFNNLKEATDNFPKASVFLNFASFRASYEVCREALSFKQFNTMVVIAEGIPERYTRILDKICREQKVNFIGPSTVGGIMPGVLRLGNTAGMIDNIMESKLYRPGSVAYVSRSGGLSNELNNIIGRVTDGVYEGVAIGGDRFPGGTFMDHLLRYQANPAIKMLVVLGEVGGTQEYDICKALKDKVITKPLVSWVYGTCATAFNTEVQFGHAGASARNQSESAHAKNAALKEAGAFVPQSFEGFADAIKNVYEDLLEKGIIVPKVYNSPKTLPIDYAWATKLGLLRKPPAFLSTISNDRGEELVYWNMKLSKVFAEDYGIGGVIGLLWFRQQLPKYFRDFIEMCLMITADHGPAVSGAHNCIVAARAGKDLISSIVSGMLTIGPRFGGALDGAAEIFSYGHDSGLTPQELVDEMRKKKKLIMGIGHLIKSVTNPDIRVTIIKDYCHKHFPATKILDYALEVEKITTKKKGTLILNVDGCIGVAFVDLLRYSGLFSKEEADNYVKMGALNALFVIGRTIGMVGHYLDQKRLNQPLYRVPPDDISYQTGVNL